MLSPLSRPMNRWNNGGGRVVRHADRCRALRWVWLMAVPLALGACSQLVDLSDPSESRPRLSSTAADVSEQDAPFPNLGSVPGEPPVVTAPEARREIMEGLIADRANAEYTRERLTAEDAAPARREEPLPEIFSVGPAAGVSGAPAVAARPASTPEPSVTPPPAVASEDSGAAATSRAASDTASEAVARSAPQGSDVPPSPVAELMQPPSEAPPDGAAGEAADKVAEAPEAPEPAPPTLEPGGVLEPGGALGPVIEAEPAEEPEAEVAALPPDAGGPGDEPAAVEAEAGTRILFDKGSAELSAAAQSELKALAEQLARNQDARVELIAYASGGDAEGTSYARRLSLSRAIAVRRFLIEQGVSSSRMDVRALGDQASEDMPADRVDVTLAAR